MGGQAFIKNGKRNTMDNLPEMWRENKSEGTRRYATEEFSVILYLVQKRNID